MGRNQWNRMALYAGAIMLAGALSGTGTNAAAQEEYLGKEQEIKVLQNSLLNVKDIWRCIGAEYPYIDGLERVGAGGLREEIKENAEESETELTLFARVKGLEGTRVYANVTNYVNVREKATTSSAVVGKLYGACVATVIEDAGDWVYVNSGNVTGYVVKKHLLTGQEAESAIAKKYTPKIQVTVNTLNVRAGAGTNYKILHTFSKGAEALLLEKGKEWMKIQFSQGGKTVTGYVYGKYVTVTGEPAVGETLAEESSRLKAEKKAAEEAAKKAEEQKKAAAEQAKRDKAKQVANYAKTAVGTAYVWGGTNMSTGVDCSGLCYAAYKKYGYTLPRVSRDMAASSSLLSVTPNTTYLKAGDLVFYASGGRVDHVAMYIGDGKVVHASDYNTGVIISRYNYRTPHSAKRVIY